MQREPLTLLATMPFLEIQRLFVKAQIGGAPVLDARGEVAGMIDTFDLLRAVDEALDDDIDPGESQGDVEDLSDRLGSLTAADVLTPHVVWVEVDVPVARVAQVMRAEGVHRVLVGERGRRLDGILTTFDLLQALADH